MKIKPSRLQRGDSIALVTPSWAGPNKFPKVYELGARRLREEFGLNIKEYSMTRASEEELDKSPGARANDINKAFADPEVRAIIATIGGEDSMRILPYIDFEKAIQSPKIFMGYSDTTTLLASLNLRGLVTFHGPSVMSGFAEPGSLSEEFTEHINSFFLKDWKTFQYRPYKKWTEELCSWGDPTALDQTRQYTISDGWRSINGNIQTGTLFGGCIEVLEFLKASEYWPEPGFWEGKILFFETSEEVPNITTVRRILRNYGIQGVFSKISGLLFGRARGYSTRQKLELEQMILDTVVKEFGGLHVAIMTNMDFGHTDPQMVIPIGCNATMDPIKLSLTINESPFI